MWVVWCYLLRISLTHNGSRRAGHWDSATQSIRLKRRRGHPYNWHFCPAKWNETKFLSYSEWYAKVYVVIMDSSSAVWKGETFTARGNNVTGFEFSMQSFVIQAWGMLSSMQWRELPATLPVKKIRLMYIHNIMQETVVERLKKRDQNS